MTARAPKSRHHRLLWLHVVGGFLDGLKMEFAPGLNCVIGCRGAGKTTVLELLRYALDHLPTDKDARKRIDAVIDRNLAFGRVEVGIQTKEGLRYIVSRSHHEEPVVMTEDRVGTSLSLRSGTLFKADIFSQNEVEGIADRSDSQLALIDSFAPVELAVVTTRINTLVGELTSNASAIAALQPPMAARRDELGELTVIEAQLKGMSASSGADAKLLNQAHAAKSLRDREKRAIESLPTLLKEYGQLINDQIGRLAQHTQATVAKDMLTGPNQQVFHAIQHNLEATGAEVDGHLEKARTALRAQWTNLDDLAKQLVKAHGEQEIAFRALIEKHQAAMGEASKRAALEKRRNDLLVKRQELTALEAQLAALTKTRAGLLHQLADARLERYTLRAQIATRITTGIHGDIRVAIKQDGNPSEYRAKLDALLFKTRVQDGSKTKIVTSLFPATLVKIVRDKAIHTLMEKAELNEVTADKVLSTLLVSDQLSALEIVELIDEPCIELNDLGTWKDSRDLSTGQKCTAILPILLMESEKPLLIDQPEDNLDNRYVSDKVVKTLREVSEQRQLLFVTHNPNIPVLGEAERVFVLDSTGTAARLVKFGSVDECKTQIVDLLEGGKKAFQVRSERYGK